MLVNDVMTTTLSSVNPNDTVVAAAQQMKLHNVGVLPVCDGGVLLGVLTDRDIALDCVAKGINPAAAFVRDHMTANPITVSPEEDVAEAYARMAEGQVRRLCVLNEDQQLVGMVSLGDLAVQAPAPELVTLLAQISEPVRSGGQRETVEPPRDVLEAEVIGGTT